MKERAVGSVICVGLNRLSKCRAFALLTARYKTCCVSEGIFRAHLTWAANFRILRPLCTCKVMASGARLQVGRSAFIRPRFAYPTKPCNPYRFIVFS
jgi:hypothetical protein